MATLIKGGRIVTAERRLRRRHPDRGRQGSDAGPGPAGGRRDGGARRQRAAGDAGGDRRAHAPGLGVRQRAHGRHLRYRHHGRGVRRHHERDRLCQPAAWREPARRPRGLAPALREPLRRRRRPHDHPRSLPAGAGRSGQARARRGRDQLQAVHGLSGRADGRRRRVFLRHARGGEARRRGLRPRRERLCDQHPGRGGGQGRQPRAEVSLPDPAARARRRGDRARDHARRIRRRSALRGPRHLQPGARRRRARPGPLGFDPRRDLHPVSVPDAGGAGAPGLPRREVRVHPALAQPGTPGRPVARPAQGGPVGGFDRSLPVLLRGGAARPEVQQAPGRSGRASTRSRTAARASSTASRCCSTARSRSAACP